MKRITRVLLMLFLMELGLSDLKAESIAEPQALFQKVLGGTLQNDYAGVMSVCDKPMKDMVTPEMLAGLSRSMVARFRGGYTPFYMGYLEKGGVPVFYWKLTLKSGGDDVLMNLTVRQGLVSAFNLK